MSKLKLLNIIKQDYWELSKKQFQYEIFNWFLKDIPGKTGDSMRNWLYRKYAAEVGKDCFFWPGVKVRNLERLYLGKNVSIGEESFLQAGGVLIIGDHVIIGPRVMIWTVNHEFADKNVNIDAQGTVGDKVIIDNNCWLGANVFIMPGVKLGEGCIVAAGSVVGKKNYPPFSILAGNPAKRIAKRN